MSKLIFGRKVKADWTFRPEDPNRLHQVLPQMEVNTPVDRIKGFRFPAPGSRHEARVPIRESEDHVYSTNYFVRDPANININVSVFCAFNISLTYMKNSFFNRTNLSSIQSKSRWSLQTTQRCLHMESAKLCPWHMTTPGSEQRRQPPGKLLINLWLFVLFQIICLILLG